MSDILDRIAKLMEQALHPNTGAAERDVFMAKADALMLQHSIDAIQVEMARDNLHSAVRVAQKPKLFEVELDDDYRRLEWDLRDTLSSIWRTVVDVNYGRIASGSFGKRRVVCYPSDWDVIQLYYTQVMMHLVSTMSPRMDPSASWEENVFRMKFSGMKWEQIHYELAFRTPHPSYPWKDMRWERRFGVKFTSVYAKQCEARGIIRNKGGNPTIWRSDFMQGFRVGFKTEAEAIRRGSVEGYSGSNLPALLMDKKDMVDEAYFELFPEERPHPDDCQCEICHFMKCSDQTCQRPRCVDYRKPVKARGPGSRGGQGHIRYVNPDAYNAGRSSGKAAATARNAMGNSTKGAIG